MMVYHLHHAIIVLSGLIMYHIMPHHICPTPIMYYISYLVLSLVILQYHNIICARSHLFKIPMWVLKLLC